MQIIIFLPALQRTNSQKASCALIMQAYSTQGVDQGEVGPARGEVGYSLGAPLRNLHKWATKQAVAA
jgi:hypothetical protein